MKFASIVPLAAAVWLSACATGTDTVPTQPPLLATSVAGNPPPPRVLGTLSGGFRIFNPATTGTGQQYNFRVGANFNRNLTTGMNFLEFEPGSAKIKANASGVVRATGIVVMTDVSTGAQLTVKLSQLVGFTGSLFVPCAVGAPANCFAFNFSFDGKITLPGGQSYPATGGFRYRWDTP